MNDKLLGWHFLPVDCRLTNGDGRLVKMGETLTHEVPLELCKSGLHASIRALDALGYATGPVICRVELGGEILQDEDKCVASERTTLAMADATDTLRTFARWCALSVAHLWDAPDVVRQFLEINNEALRRAAWEAPGEAARSAARAATRHVTWAATKYAAGAAARAAAGAAVWSDARPSARADTRYAIWAAAKHAARANARPVAGIATKDVARANAQSAAWIAARDEQNKRLESMLFELLGLEEEAP